MPISTTPTMTIRTARLEDIPALGPVETSAAALFNTAIGLEWIARDDPMDASKLQTLASLGHVWVAVVGPINDEKIIGFAAVDPKDNSFFVTEISVHADWQRKGIAKKLMAALEEQGKQEGYEFASLTTYVHLPWNAPFYRSRGFVDVDLKEAGREHLQELEEEGKHGHPVNKRCVMRKRL